MIAQILLYIVLFSWILPHIIPDKHWTRYYVCYFTGALYVSIAIVIFVFFNLLLPQKLVRKLAALSAEMTSLMVGIEWEFRNNKIHTEQQILVSNHQSIFDCVGMLVILDYVGSYIPVIKQEAGYFWPVTALGYVCGAIFVDRTDPKAAVEKINKLADAHFRRHKDAQILIFPEGTRKMDKPVSGLLPFKKGAFKLAIDQKKPILPIVFSPYYFIKKNKLFSRGKVIISFLEPISSAEFGQDDVEKLMEKTRTIMENEYNKLKSEINSKSDVK